MGPRGLFLTGSLVTRLLFPRGVTAGVAYRVGLFRFGLSVSAFTSGKLVGAGVLPVDRVPLALRRHRRSFGLTGEGRAVTIRAAVFTPFFLEAQMQVTKLGLKVLVALMLVAGVAVAGDKPSLALSVTPDDKLGRLPPGSASRSARRRRT